MDEDTNDDIEVPADILPLFFTSKTQEIFQCKVDQDVTEEKLYKIVHKEQILQDFKDRAAISDFYPAKKIVEAYESDELLIVYDPVFLYGQNFFLVTTEEYKQLLLNPVVESLGSESVVGEESIQAPRGLRTPRPWVPLGSEAEVLDETVSTNRIKKRFIISRKREHFGCPIDFEDRFETEDLKEVVVDCFSYDDAGTGVSMKELNKAVQHVPVLVNSSAQTIWPCPKNVNAQSTPRTNTEEENDTILRSNAFLDFFSEVIPRLEFALEQNATLDVFTNDYLHLGEEDSTFGSKLDNHLKEYQSFTDLHFSKNKRISDIHWHPTIKGLIAVSCMEQMSFYERVENSSYCLMTPSLILIWSFADPIHPLLLLEAPDDILCFQFNPVDPNIVCAGCLNGQIILWDLSKHDDLLLNHRTQGQSSQANQNMSNLPVFMAAVSQDLSPILSYSAVSSIEHSHHMAVTDIQWIPDHIEIGRLGVVLENKSRHCSQIMSCASDGHVLFWDTRATKSTLHSQSSRSLLPEHRSLPFQHLDLTWKPFQKITVHRLKGSGEYSPVKFSISEVQSTVKKEAPSIEPTPSERPDTAGVAYKKKDEAKVLEVNSKFFVGTEEGELVYLDWKPTKDIDTGKIISSNPEFCLDAHDSDIVAIQKSPFLKDIILTVGGWNFSIWKEGVIIGPLFQSYSHNTKLTAGYWSPTRAAVFFIGKSDGCIDVWDLLDRTHEPFLSQSITPVPITTIYPYQISKRQQLLAAGDDVGTLHIVEVPWNLKQATTNELTLMESYLEREASRLQCNDDLKKTHLTLKAVRKDEEQNQEKPIELDEEWEEKAKKDYLNYLELEKQVLIDLGVIREDDG